MKGRTVTKEEKQFHDNLCRHVGCIACRFEGRFNDWVSVHHIGGRTKPDAHKKVLPLCAGHHQDNGTAIAVHPHKARFEAEYGHQFELLIKCVTILREKKINVPERVLEITGFRVVLS